MTPITQYLNNKNLAYLTVAAAATAAIVLGALNFSSLCNFIPTRGSYALLFGGLGLNAALIFSNCKKKNMQTESYRPQAVNATDSSLFSQKCKEVKIGSEQISIYVLDRNERFSGSSDTNAFLENFIGQMREKANFKGKSKYLTIMIADLKGDTKDDNALLKTLLTKPFSRGNQYIFDNKNLENTILVLTAPYNLRAFNIFDQLHTKNLKTGEATAYGVFKNRGGRQLNIAYEYRAVEKILDKILIFPDQAKA